MKDINKDIKIRVANANDIDKIYNLMKSVYDELEDKSIYVHGDLNYVAKRVNNLGSAVVAEYNGEVVGSLIYNYPANKKENYGVDINLPEDELDLVVTMENAAVSLEYRGNNLEYRMLDFVENMIDREKYKYFLATVSPINEASKKTLERLGYKIEKKVNKYGGLERYIYCKCNN